VKCEIPDEEFRAAGKTGASRNFPLSDRACEWLAAFNGVPVETMPRAWRFAANAYMQEFIERRAAA
jgi:hypothetical protein